MKLIDSSSWINALRKDGDPVVRSRVQQLLIEDEAAWCDIVRVELWRGVSKRKEINFLRELEKNISLLPITTEVWDLACTLAQKCRSKGTPIPSTDIVIEACRRVHHVELEHVDKHFEIICRL